MKIGSPTMKGWLSHMLFRKYFHIIRAFFIRRRLSEEQSLHGNTAQPQMVSGASTLTWEDEYQIKNDVLMWARTYRFDEGSDTVALAIEHCLRNPDDYDAQSWFNPAGGGHVEAYMEGEDRAVRVMALAHRDGTALIERVVEAWIGPAKIKQVNSVLVSSHETYYLNKDDKVIVAFYGTGRKCHYSDPFRAKNAQHALGMLSIEVTLEEIAMRDMAHFYPPLKFERQEDGTWTSFEMDPIRA